MEELATLKVAQPLEVAVRRLFEDTVQRLEHALHAVCSDFHGDRYGKVRHMSILVWHAVPPVCMALCGFAGASIRGWGATCATCAGQPL